jgi:hypothetical protein
MCFFSRDDLQNSPVSERTNTLAAREAFLQASAKRQENLEARMNSLSGLQSGPVMTDGGLSHQNLECQGKVFWMAAG